MAKQFRFKVNVLLEKEELNTQPFVTSVLEMPLDGNLVRFTIEPNISRDNRKPVKVNVELGTSKGKRSP